MKLYLVQHAEAKATAEDPERSITAEGAEAARRMADWAAGIGLEIAEIRHSGKLRARQTAEILGARLEPPGGIVAVAGLRALDDVEPLAEAFAAEERSLLLVGHLPHLARLAARLIAGDKELAVVRFRNAGIVCLAREEGTWSLQWALVPHLID